MKYYGKIHLNKNAVIKLYDLISPYYLLIFTDEASPALLCVFEIFKNTTHQYII